MKWEKVYDGSGTLLSRKRHHDHCADNCKKPWELQDPLAHCPRCCPRDDHMLIHDDHDFGGITVSRWSHRTVMLERFVSWNWWEAFWWTENQLRLTEANYAKITGSRTPNPTYARSARTTGTGAYTYTATLYRKDQP
jgi:hypothetical protein